MTYRRAYIEISNICNLQCSFCPPVERAKQVMEPAEFARLAAQLTGLVDEVCLHLMGEPLNHPDVAEIFALCAAHGLPVNLTSNGLLLTGSRRALALAPIVRQVNLSVHSFADNFPERDAGAYMERIFQFTRQALASRPDLYINLRLWDLQNEGSLTPLNAEIRAAIAGEFGVDLSAAALDVRRQKHVALRGRIYAHFDSRFTWPSLALPERTRQGFCHGLSSHFGVHADGTVVPCCLDKEAVLALGNTADQPLRAVLDGPRARAIKDGFARGELVEPMCQRCPFISRFDRKARRRKGAAAHVVTPAL